MSVGRLSDENVKLFRFGERRYVVCGAVRTTERRHAPAQRHNVLSERTFDVPRQIFLHLERPDLEKCIEVYLRLVASWREIRNILAERGRILPFDLAVLSFLPLPEGCDCRLRAVHVAR